MSTELRTNLTVVDHGEGDEPQVNYSLNPTFASVLQARLARRDLLKGSLGAAALGFMGVGLAGCNSGSSSRNRNDDENPVNPPAALLGFTAIPTSESDDIIVPEGYSYQVLIPWGTPIAGSFPSFSINNSGDDQAMQIGMHHDGMHFFPIEGEEPFEGSSEDGLLVLNHEYVEPRYMHASHLGQSLSSGAVLVNAGVRATDEVLKEMNAHGISIVRVRKGVNNEWSVQPDSLNRRITALTPMEIQGPVRGSSFVRTLYSPNGTMTRGTLNNCAHGVTPWNTYMFSEENWAGYFRNGGDNPREHSRYGVNSSPTGTGRYAWELAESGEDQYIRFDASIKGADATADYRNEPNCFGWMCEVDPFDPTSVPKKRTALGRFAHEGVVFAPAVEGKPVVCYSGDDSTFQFIYKFVSAENYNRNTASGALLDTGTLYVARFNADGSGEWLPLVYGQNGLTNANGFTSQADVLVNTRLAATTVGATPMDRPEWGAVDPNNGDVYFTLTNNSARTEDQATGANPRAVNRHGHIIRWAEADGEHASNSFEWDIFLFAGDGGESGQDNLTGRDLNGDVLGEEAYMSSPDGLWIDKDSRVWIQTDIGEGSQNNGVFEIFGNNQMFAANPETGEIRRFLTGPIGQEITGVITTPDQRTMFINVQHPGATATPAEWAAGETRSTWPDHMPSLYPPRSATVVIWKDDGGVIGT
ncbi:PhoX family protein [Halopseudomonas phragmitis]|uniref:Tat pathway signal protein n=1 Tax=Halopseudomonas phragmitis TaxID=1931241 RepID=A0A1V0B564_9GAMM|nr:PhoX family phosphatase [Halopseudomonas phragmitis]AQZ95078.1 Tat pathway signal protein [Halopseudomonas phragmitis]